MTDQTKLDMQALLAMPEFRRFLWRLIQSGRVLDQTGSGKSERDLAYAEGRRDQALEVLTDAEQGQPAEHPESIPILTLIQILREEVQQPPTKREKSRDRYDRNAEPDDDNQS